MHSIIITIVFTVLFLIPFSFSKESDYQKSWCSSRGGQIEVVLSDRTRVDCLTNTHAIEFDHAKKWAESIGQSLYYAFHTNKRAGIVLIVKSEKDKRYLMRLNSVIVHNKLAIDVCTMKSVNDLSCNM